MVICKQHYETTILEAIIYVLYGANAMTRDNTVLNDYYTQGTKALEVTMKFNFNGKDYKIYRAQGPKAVAYLQQLSPIKNSMAKSLSKHVPNIFVFQDMKHKHYYLN